jgi:hypothetical protein
MTSKFISVLALGVICTGGWYGFHAATVQDEKKAPAKIDPGTASKLLEDRFATKVKPFLEKYCFSCHGPKKQEAALDLSHDMNVSAIVKNIGVGEQVLDRLHEKEMPPEKAKLHPKENEREAVIAWIRDLREHEARRNAGDPGPVLAHRLSNAEYDYTIRDLTGVDIRPTKEFPVDPANQAGFDNTGESLAMSPALLKKYLAAARHVAGHIILKPEGFVFAPHPVVTETDRDKYCVQRIIDFYKRHQVDYADYFLASWKYQHRAKLGRPDAKLSDLATEANLSVTYLTIVWSVLSEGEADVGPLTAVRKMWSELPQAADKARPECEKMRDVVVRLRKQLKAELPKMNVNGMSAGSQPIVLWRNSQLASKHRSYAGDAIADLKKLSEQLKGLERFCDVLPDAFVVTDRGPYFAPNQAGQGRPLTAGFHLMQGYFRDDQPLYALILDGQQRREIDALWHELNFITLAPMRQYADFIFFERAEPPRFMFEAEFDFARSEDKDCTSAEKMDKLAKMYLAKAVKRGAKGDAVDAIAAFFNSMSTEIRKIEKGRLAAEASHLDSLVKFAERAYRRPLTKAEGDDLRAFYRQLRKKDDPGHEDALRDVLTSVLISPHFCYRFQVADPGKKATPLSQYELANRLSYFLWSSMPDAELLEHAKAGDLHKPDVLIKQTRRMLRDPKVRGLATEFAGNWLDIRRFEEHNAVDRQRFPTFTNELRQAMFVEPIHYFIDVAQTNRSVLDLIYGKDTFVNPALAKHYGIATKKEAGVVSEWVHVEDADKYGRGGMLPMAVFQTKNAPGLRTSPVKRGYWVVRRVLGEQIPPPPPTVPELPKDEAKLGELTLPQVLARHRADKSCAGCHKRFDAVGIVFEDFGPIGERRTKDLGGRPVEITAPFPDGKDRTGLAGLRNYLKEKRQDDFVDNLCKKLFSYGLGRSLQLSDKLALDALKAKLPADEYRLGSIVEAIVSSPQFLNKRGRDEP